MEASEKSFLVNLINEMPVSDTAENETTPEYLSDSAAYLEKLSRRLAAFSENHKFTNGEFVTWKDGLKNKRIPEYGQPVIVVNVMPPETVNNESYSEVLDVLLGFIDEDEFLVYRYDSRRFRPYLLP